MAGKYKINRSNYTVRSRHQMTSGGVVYERDFMTTTNLGGWDSGSIPYGEGNFRILYRKTENARKRPRPGFWLEHESGCTGTESTTYWTSGCVEKSGVTEEKSIKIKPNYNSLLDFAYYGSCQELVKSTIKRIINDFPGELMSVLAERYNINGSEYIQVKNPFGIDVFDDGIYSNVKNFGKHYNRYVMISGEESPISSCTIEKFEGCNHGDIIATAHITAYNGAEADIYKIIYSDSILLFTTPLGFEIRPDKEAVDEFFNGLDDFGNLLLNRDSVPKYTATLDWPHETEYGVKTYRRSFTWPMDGEWNLDIVSEGYGNYIDDILSIAEFYDEGYSDNLWRMLTHDSIKGMDLAFSDVPRDEDQSDYTVGSTRLEGLLWAYGRQFDDLKRAIDNIKFTSNITYDENNNLPDYFLSDTLELSGWEVYNIDKGIEGETVSLVWGENEKSGVTIEYTSEDANNAFLRELKLNSKNILKKKGTRDGIISLLGLFGMEYGEDFEMHEEVAVVCDQIEKKGTDEQFELERLNALKASYPTSTEYEGFNTLEGLPFTYVEIREEEKKYIIPWFDKNLSYDGGMYFQMNGGWSKDAVGNYVETLKYLTIVDKTSDLFTLPTSKIYKGSVCYCEGDGKYYELVDVEKYDKIEGWNSGVTYDSGKTNYLESIVDDFTGNNPHVGYGKYDDGKEYLERIRVPFSYHVSADTPDNPMFNDAAYDCNGNYDSGFKNTKICLNTGVTDDRKVWFFGDYIDGSKSKRTGVCEGCESSDVTGGTSDYGEIGYDIFDFDTGELGKTRTEAAADSIINTKGLSFIFYTYSKFIGEFSEYLKNVILPYLSQMLPTSSLWKYKVIPKDAELAEIEDIAPISLTVDAVAYGEGNTDINDDIIANYSEGHNIKFNNNN